MVGLDGFVRCGCSVGNRMSLAQWVFLLGVALAAVSLVGLMLAMFDERYDEELSAADDAERAK